jgi:hypothetical protein
MPALGAGRLTRRFSTARSALEARRETHQASQQSLSYQPVDKGLRDGSDRPNVQVELPNYMDVSLHPYSQVGIEG